MSESISIISIIDHPSKAALPRFFVPLCLKLNEKWVNHQAVLMQSSPEAKEVSVKGLTVNILWKKSFLRTVSDFRRIIREAQADVVHAHSKEVFFVALWAARLEKKRFVYSAHTPNDLELASLWLRQADTVTVASEGMEEGVQEKKKIKASHLIRVPDGVDLDRLDYQTQAQSLEEVRSSLNLGAHRFVIGNVAPLIKEEDPLTLLKAFRKLVQKNLDAELIFLGQGPLKEEMDLFIQAHQLEERVQIISEWDNIYTFVNACDCIILTTFGYDRSTMVLLASALGKPVIATKIGRHEEVIVENKTGYLVPCGFPERIDSAVMRLKAIPTLAAQIGREGREWVRKKYSLESMTQSYLDIYQKALKEEKKGHTSFQ